MFVAIMASPTPGRHEAPATDDEVAVCRHRPTLHRDRARHRHHHQVVEICWHGQVRDPDGDHRNGAVARHGLPLQGVQRRASPPGIVLGTGAGVTALMASKRTAKASRGRRIAGDVTEVENSCAISSETQSATGSMILDAQARFQRGGAERVDIDIRRRRWYAVLIADRAWSRRRSRRVIFSGAGPPAPILYLMPKSPCGPPGLCKLAERMIPPNALRLRITQEAAGVDRSSRLCRPSPGRSRQRPPSCSTHLDHLGDYRSAASSPPTAASDWPSQPCSEENTDCTRSSSTITRGCWNTGTFLRRPEVPGFWPSKGVVDSSYGFGIQLINDADHNTIKRCKVNLNITSSSSSYSGIAITSTDDGVDSWVFNSNCDSNTYCQ